MTRTLFIFLILFESCKTTSNFIIKTASSEILYIGVDNPIILKGKRLSKTQVSIDNGILTSLDSMPNDTLRSYLIKVNNSRPTYLRINNGRTTTTLQYKNKQLPDPEILIGSDSGFIKSNEVQFEKIKSSKYLLAVYNSFNYNIAIKVLSYKLTQIKNNNSYESTYKTNSVSCFQNPQSGDIFVFHDVLVEFVSNKEQRLLSGPTIRVK